jgi:hypothetical protein
LIFWVHKIPQPYDQNRKTHVIAETLQHSDL